jgi:hypothetical protein
MVQGPHLVGPHTILNTGKLWALCWKQTGFYLPSAYLRALDIYIYKDLIKCRHLSSDATTWYSKNLDSDGMDKALNCLEFTI